MGAHIPPNMYPNLPIWVHIIYIPPNHHSTTAQTMIRKLTSQSTSGSKLPKPRRFFLPDGALPEKPTPPHFHPLFSNPTENQHNHPKSPIKTTPFPVQSVPQITEIMRLFLLAISILRALCALNIRKMPTLKPTLKPTLNKISTFHGKNSHPQKAPGFPKNTL